MCVVLLVIAACSSSTKTPEESRAPAPVATPAPEKPAGSGDSWEGKPDDPAADAALLRADVDVICNAAKVTGGKTWIDIGPHIAETMKTMHKIGLFADHRTTTLDEFIERIRGLMAKANVTQCDTVDVLIANDPRKRP